MNNISLLTKTDFVFEIHNDVKFSMLTNFLVDVAPLYPNFHSWLNFTFRRNLASGERHIVLAHDGYQIIGTALLKKSRNENKICTLFVSPQYRNLNVGTNLVDIALSTLDSSDTFITVSEERRNELAPLLCSKGFTIKQSFNGLYRENNTEHFYTL